MYKGSKLEADDLDIGMFLTEISGNWDLTFGALLQVRAINFPLVILQVHATATFETPPKGRELITMDVRWLPQFHKLNQAYINFVHQIISGNNKQPSIAPEYISDTRGMPPSDMSASDVNQSLVPDGKIKVVKVRSMDDLIRLYSLGQLPPNAEEPIPPNAEEPTTRNIPVTQVTNATISKDKNNDKKRIKKHTKRNKSRKPNH